MKKIVSPNKIYVAQSVMENAGRGVFANEDIKKGELIEACPIIKIPQHEEEIVNQSMLVTYIYYLGDKKNNPVITLGYGSIYNHTKKPNAKYRANLKNEVIEFIAIKDIKKDEEITVNYSPETKDNGNPMWFESKMN